MAPRYNGPAMRAPLLSIPLLFACICAVFGCVGSATPPPGWQQGGAPLFVPRATWTFRYNAVELLPDGRVIVNERHVFSIDRAGRVYDPDGRPIALLRPDGRLVGPGEDDLGAVAPTAAALPGEGYASLAIAPDGRVIKQDDSDPTSLGSWAGCGFYAMSLQACMLVTLLVSTKFQPYRPINRYPTTPYGTPVMPGYGVGLGLP